MKDHEDCLTFGWCGPGCTSTFRRPKATAAQVRAERAEAEARAAARAADQAWAAHVAQIVAGRESTDYLRIAPDLLRSADLIAERPAGVARSAAYRPVVDAVYRLGERLVAASWHDGITTVWTSPEDADAIRLQAARDLHITPEAAARSRDRGYQYIQQDQRRMYELVLLEAGQTA